jgi:predicted protein tyrosine phosphatase
MIACCPLSRLSETVAATGARRVLSLVSEGTPVARPDGVAAADHLVITFHDIPAPRDGYVHPSKAHIGEALAFAAADDGPLVVHCYAGVSRSTAMAFALACARSPEVAENEIARLLRQASPTATPNPLIVSLADAALGRSGRMSAAIAALGRGQDAFEGAPFRLAPGATP